MPTRRNLKRLALLAVLPVVLAVGEVGVRVFDLGPPPRPVISGVAVHPVDDPALRFAPAPGAERVVEYPAHGGHPVRRVVQRVNALGLRGPEVATPKPAGVLRIACIGDSHTFGEGVGDAGTWPRMLEADLRARFGERIEVLNAGVQGYDTVQEARWLEFVLERLEPDLVLVQFFVNDANLRDTTRPEDHAGWLLAAAHPRSDGLASRVRRHSRLVDAALETIFRRGYFDHWSAGNTRHTAADEPGWARWTDAVDRIEQACRARSVPWGVAMYPLMHAPDGEYVSRTAHERAADFLTSAGVAWHDAEPAFHGRDPVSLRVHPGDLHAGAEANRLFADSVAGWLAGWEPFLERAQAPPRGAGGTLTSSSR